MSKLLNCVLRWRHLTWPGDLTWYDLGPKFLHRMRKGWMNSYAKFGGAARRHFSAICEKPMGGTYVPPPAVRGLIVARKIKNFAPSAPQLTYLPTSRFTGVIYHRQREGMRELSIKFEQFTYWREMQSYVPAAQNCSWRWCPSDLDPRRHSSRVGGGGWGGGLMQLPCGFSGISFLFSCRMSPFFP